MASSKLAFFYAKNLYICIQFRNIDFIIKYKNTFSTITKSLGRTQPSTFLIQVKGSRIDNVFSSIVDSRFRKNIMKYQTNGDMFSKYQIIFKNREASKNIYSGLVVWVCV